MRKLIFASVFIALLCLSITQVQAQVDPAGGLDFGNVPLGTDPAPIDIVTLTNDYGEGIQLSAEVTGPGFTLISPLPTPPGDIPPTYFPGGMQDFTCEFSPVAEGDATGLLTITVTNLAGEVLEVVDVDLIGTGGEEEDPCDLIALIIDDYNQWVDEGELMGTGHCPQRRVRAMRCRLKAIGWLCKRGYYCHASYLTRTAILRSDDEPCPVDFVKGAKRQCFNDQLVLLEMLLQ